MSDQILQALLTIAFGALAGGLTNTVAIWMLFHPYEPPTLFGRTIGFFQGAIPKNQGRLAAAVGKTVGTRLLTEEDLTHTFADREFRGAFDDRLSQRRGKRHPSRDEIRPVFGIPRRMHRAGGCR